MVTAILAADAPAVHHVVTHMRRWDRREIFATRWTDEAVAFTNDIMAVPGSRGVAWVDDEPVACIGAMPMWHGVWSPWCFGTDRFPEAALLLTRHAKRVIIPFLRDAGAHRLEVKTLDGHEDSQAWLKRCFGCHREATHPGYGRNGETFHTYVLRL